MKLLLVPLFLFGLSSPVVAWGKDGHRMICAMAEQLLSAPKQQALQALVAKFNVNGVTYDSFTEGCLFADFVKSKTKDEAWKRYKNYGPLHYINVPRKTKQLRGTRLNTSHSIAKGIRVGYSYTATIGVPR